MYIISYFYVYEYIYIHNVYIHSTQTDIFQVFISFNFDDYITDNYWKPQIQYLRKFEYYLRPIQRKDF